jgi:hypothetical protein
LLTGKKAGKNSIGSWAELRTVLDILDFLDVRRRGKSLACNGVQTYSDRAVRSLGAA